MAKIERKSIIIAGIILLCAIISYFSMEVAILVKLLFSGAVAGLSSTKVVALFLVLFIFYVISKLKIKEKKTNISLIFGLIILLGVTNLAATLVFYEYNSLPLEEIDMVYSQRTDTFTYNNLTHTHTMKPAMLPLTNKPIGAVDTAPEMYDFMPWWAQTMYGAFFLLYIVFALQYIKRFGSMDIKQKKDKLIFAFAGFFLVSNSLFDGGILNHLFISGTLFVILTFGNTLNFKNLKESWKKSGMVVFAIAGNVFERAIGFFSDFALFKSIDGIIKEKNLVNKLFWVAVIILIVYLSIFFGRREVDTLKTYYTEIDAGTEIGGFTQYIDTTNKNIEFVKEEGSISIYKTKQKIILKDFLKKYNNEKIIYEVFYLGKYCDYFITKNKIRIFTEEKIENYKNDYYNTLNGIDIHKTGNNEYTMSFLRSTCVKDSKQLIAYYLTEHGVTKFAIIG